MYTTVNFAVLITRMWMTRRPPRLSALLPDADAFGDELATLGIVTAEFLIHTPALTPVAVLLAAYLHCGSLVYSLHRAAAIDPKTSLPNLTAWSEHDTYGHLIGDRVFAAVAQCLRQALRRRTTTSIASAVRNL